MTLEERIKQIEILSRQNSATRTAEMICNNAKEALSIIQELQNKNKELEETNQQLFEAAEAMEKQNE